jgi:hypothetical protein
MGVKSGCKPRVDVLQGELDDAIFAASFDKLTRGEGPLIYRDPALFFQNTTPPPLSPNCAAMSSGAWHHPPIRERSSASRPASAAASTPCW